MFSVSAILVICCAYMALLFALAGWTERKAAAGRDLGDNPIIYALSLTVYLTAWSFYGTVGKAASSGMLYLTFYLGPTLGMFLWWIMVRKMVRVRNSFRVTSIADFISLRYNKSMAIAALVTIISIVGIVPYLSLQLKAIISTFGIITGSATEAGQFRQQPDIAFVVVGLLIVFTILMGVRRLAPTERHQGMVVSLAAVGVVKLVAIVVGGAFIVYSMHDGFGDLFAKFSNTPRCEAVQKAAAAPTYYVTWFSHLLLSMSAFLFLPRQFHVAVVENFREKHIRTAMWLCPLYMLLFSVFVLPIAMGGLLQGYPLSKADGFVLLLPMSSGNELVSLLVFLGGLSAAVGMTVISSMTVSTMATNHLLLPVVEYLPALKPLKRCLLQCRWIAVAILIAAGFWFQDRVTGFATLVDVGLISFVAVLQFAPAAIGGLFWKKGNKIGALTGMTGGALVWAYTLILPAFVRGGMISESLLLEGPWGAGALRPEQLLGAAGLDSISHALFWTMLVNVGFYIAGSLIFKQSLEEFNNSESFRAAMEIETAPERKSGEASIDLADKRNRIVRLFHQYYSTERSVRLTQECLAALKLDREQKICLVELAELQNEVEKRLAGSIGAATAHRALRRSDIVSPAEEDALKRMLTDIVAGMKLTPATLAKKIVVFQEQEKTRAIQAKQLQEKIDERDREIAERRRAEESLRDSERRLVDILNFLPDATFAVDLEGRVILWNRAAEELTGFKAEDMLGKGDYEYGFSFYGERRPILIDLVLKPHENIEKTYPYIERRGRMLTTEAYSRCVKGKQVYALAVASPLCDSQGNVVGAIESIRDINDRKQAEDELKKHRDHLEELVEERTAELARAKEAAVAANRAKSDFLANMSHEIRSPMTAILGYADILLAHAYSREIIDAVNIIKRNGDHLLTVINDILDLSRIEAGKDVVERVSCSPVAILAETESLMRVRAAAKGLPLRFAYHGPIPETIQTDPVRLRQILINLLGNAVKFTADGQIRVDVGMTVAESSGLPALRIDITDTGIGLTKEQIDRLFQPFTQADESITRNFGGTGLGLAISKRLAKKLGGDISVVSAAGKGSTFTVVVDTGALSEVRLVENPVHAFRPEEPDVRERVEVRFDPGVRILLVEDGYDNQRLLSHFLEKAGAEVMVAENGDIALKKVVASIKGYTRREGDPSGPFDLILMDIQMPIMDGYEATRLIRDAGYAGPVIALTAHAMKDDRDKCLEAGCDDYITKPVKRDAFLKTVARYLSAAVERQPVQG